MALPGANPDFTGNSQVFLYAVGMLRFQETSHLMIFAGLPPSAVHSSVKALGTIVSAPTMVLSINQDAIKHFEHTNREHENFIKK